MPGSSRPIEEGKEFIVTALPLYHIFALTANCLTFLMIGARNLLIANPRDMPGFVKEWKKYPISVSTGVNTLFNGLLNHPDFASIDFSTMKLSLGGGMAVQAPVADRWQKVTGSAAAAGLRPDRDIAGGDHQSAESQGIQRLDRLADFVDRGFDPRR